MSGDRGPRKRIVMSGINVLFFSPGGTSTSSGRSSIRANVKNVLILLVFLLFLIASINHPFFPPHVSYFLPKSCSFLFRPLYVSRVPSPTRCHKKNFSGWLHFLELSFTRFPYFGINFSSSFMGGSTSSSGIFFCRQIPMNGIAKCILEWAISCLEPVTAQLLFL